VIANLLEAHAVAARALRETDRTDADGDGHATWIGAAKHWVLLDPKRPWWPLDRIAASANHAVFNVAVARALAGGPIDLRIPGARPALRDPDVMRGSSDFLGVNYYTRWMVTLFGKDPRTARAGAPVNDLGWENYPEGLERALEETARFGLPLVVTENGIADATDRFRAAFLERSLEALDRARQAGADVRGYFHWSLMDNFEWADGHEGRFGLYEVDFDNPAGRRVKRASADRYADLVRHRLSTRPR